MFKEVITSSKWIYSATSAGAITHSVGSGYVRIISPTLKNEDTRATRLPPFMEVAS